MDRLTEYDTVMINLPVTTQSLRVADFECIVIALSPTGAALEPLAEAARALPAQVEHVLLSFAKQGKLVGLKGTLSQPAGAGFLHFTVEDGVQVPRRRTTRVDAQLDVTLRPDGESEGRRGATINLSADGLLAAVDLDVRAGDLLEVSLELPGSSSPVQTRGRVVRRAEGLIAVELLPELRDARTQIDRFVVAQVSAAWREQRHVVSGVATGP